MNFRTEAVRSLCTNDLGQFLRSQLLSHVGAQLLNQIESATPLAIRLRRSLLTGIRLLRSRATNPAGKAVDSNGLLRGIAREDRISYLQPNHGKTLKSERCDS